MSCMIRLPDASTVVSVTGLLTGYVSQLVRGLPPLLCCLNASAVLNRNRRSTIQTGLMENEGQISNRARCDCNVSNCISSTCAGSQFHLQWQDNCDSLESRHTQTLCQYKFAHTSQSGPLHNLYGQTTSPYLFGHSADYNTRGL